ncbi:hypothetical protein N0V84_000609 [Fusarium piperis]|uniref:Uncharacterized protein n=1 Tax=Fusarium piperis TaxID=1435070 RepID=A0A9W9BUJ0_9HYPO|nr:hypothetical protein N0V84_000609 [Fusarium piperis]
MRKATAQKPAPAGDGDSTQRNFDNDIQADDQTVGPAETVEPQASRISPSVSIRTVRQSERTDAASSIPGPTQESTGPQVASSGSQFDHIPKIPGCNEAAQVLSDELTNRHGGPGEKATDNAQTGAQSTMDEDKLGDSSDVNTLKEAITNDAETRKTIKEQYGTTKSYTES